MQRVLIVDDDRLVADTLTLIFEKNGFKAKAAYSADEALQSSREFGPHLLLCEFVQPPAHLLLLSRELKADHECFKVLPVRPGPIPGAANLNE